MIRLRSFQPLVALPALLVTLGFSPLAHADVAFDANAAGPPDECAESAKAGDACNVAGPDSNKDGVCVKEVCPGKSNANECSDFAGTYIICELPVDAGPPPKKDGGTEADGGKGSGDGGDMMFNQGGGCSTSGGVGSGGSAWFFFGVGAIGLLASSVSRRRRRS